MQRGMFRIVYFNFVICTNTCVRDCIHVYVCAVLVAVSIQPSATHRSKADKTSIDLLWRAPNTPSSQNVVFW